MLHLETVAPDTLGLLKYISSTALAQETRLVGGTALALQYGHRRSVDLDFFGNIGLEDEEIVEILREFGETQPLKKSKSIKVFTCNNIKVDFVNFNYPWLRKAVKYENIVLADPVDIAAMKISAITGRGSSKDFYDIYELLKNYDLKEILNFYQEKFNDGSVYLALKSLIYFEDAEREFKENIDLVPEILNHTTWADVKAKILSAHHNFMQSL